MQDKERRERGLRSERDVGEEVERRGQTRCAVAEDDVPEKEVRKGEKRFCKSGLTQTKDRDKARTARPDDNDAPSLSKRIGATR